MDIGPDGSLCRITSSAKDIINNIKIVKVSEDKLLNNGEPLYKLVFIGENDSESSSEKADEEVLEADNFNVSLSTENIEKVKDVKGQEAVEQAKPPKEMSAKKTFNRFQSKSTQWSHKNHKKFPGSRNFNSAARVPKTYNRSVTNTSCQDIDPWLNPPWNDHASIMECPLNSSTNSGKTVGLLGDSPYANYSQHNFQSSNQSNPFGHGQNFWNNKYSSGYQTSVKNIQISSQSDHKKYYHQNKRWNNKGRSKQWKRNQNGNQQERRESEGHFNHRN